MFRLGISNAHSPPTHRKKNNAGSLHGIKTKTKDTLVEKFKKLFTCETLFRWLGTAWPQDGSPQCSLFLCRKKKKRGS